jgi:hypothetical protein
VGLEGGGVVLLGELDLRRDEEREADLDRGVEWE